MQIQSDIPNDFTKQKRSKLGTESRERPWGGNVRICEDHANRTLR